MPILFEPATTEDAEALVGVAVAAFHHDSVLYPHVEVGGPPGYDSAEFMRKKITREICYKIVEDDAILGGIVIFPGKDSHYHLDLIFIHPDHHNRGIGTQAIDFIEKQHPATRWTLDTPAWAVRNIHFYEKLGYQKVNEFEHDDIKLIAFEKHVPS